MLLLFIIRIRKNYGWIAERMKSRFKLIVSMGWNLLLDSLLAMIYVISARVGKVEYEH